MNKTLLSAGAALACTLLSTSSAMADEPTLELAMDFASKKVSQGVVDNKEGIISLGATLEYAGFFGSVTWITDPTDRFGCQWKYREIDYAVGYGFALGNYDIAFDYTYESDGSIFEDGDWSGHDWMDYLHFSVSRGDLWLNPAFSAEFGLHHKQMLFTFGVSHTFTLIGAEDEEGDDVLSLTIDVSQNFGDRNKNAGDLEISSWALRDTQVTATLDWNVNDSLTISPYVAFADEMPSRIRHASREASDDHKAATWWWGISATATF